MPNLTKRALVLQISEKSWLRQQEISTIIQHLLDGITEALASGRNVEIRNFGVFEVKLTQPRPGRNPKKPDIVVAIPSRAAVKFKSGKLMAQRVLLQTQELSRKAKAQR